MSGDNDKFNRQYLPPSMSVITMQYKETETRQVRYTGDSNLRAPTLGDQTI
jgi:hypothetical protein